MILRARHLYNKQEITDFRSALVTISRQDSERSCLCVLRVWIYICAVFRLDLELYRQCGNFLFFMLLQAN
jgi:hypothetical protein